MENLDLINYTDHAWFRMFNRSISRKDVSLCIKFGEVYYKTGIKFYVITRKVINRYGLNDDLEGLCALVAPNNSLITIYKNRDAIGEIKKLSKNNKKKFYRSN